MDHFAGLDVSVKATSVCIVDDTGKVVREVKVTSEPEALLAVLKNPAYLLSQFDFPAVLIRRKGGARWSCFPEQNGGLAKVDSGLDYAANFSSLACVA